MFIFIYHNPIGLSQKDSSPEACLYPVLPQYQLNIYVSDSYTNNHYRTTELAGTGRSGCFQHSNVQRLNCIKCINIMYPSKASTEVEV